MDPENNNKAPEPVDYAKMAEDIAAQADKTTHQIAQDVSGASADPDSTTLPPNTDDFSTSPDISDQLGSLDDDIDKIDIDDGKTQESKNAFEQLKSRYKADIDNLREKVAKKEAELESKIQALDSEKSDVLAKKDYNQQVEDLLAKNQVLEKDLAEKEARLKESSHYIRKYDAEKDPVLQQKYLQPMEEFKKRGLDILKNYGMNENDWTAMVNSTEVDSNNIIDGAGITGLNSTSLRQYLDAYQIKQQDYNSKTDPEHIEATIQNARGEAVRFSDGQASQIFENVKTNFSGHISEVKYDEFNKEHNIFVYDDVVAKATKGYESLRAALGPGYHTEQVMSAIATTALMSAAYPMNKKMIDHLLKEREKHVEDIRELTEGPGVTQTREKAATNGFNTASIEEIANMSIEDIAKSSLS